MSPAPNRRGSLKPSGKNIKKGICQNHKYYNPDTGETGDCPKCASGEIQFVNVQRLSDFKCDVCGSKLTPVGGGVNKKLIAIIAGVIILAIAIVLFCMGVFTSSDEKKAQEGSEPVEIVTDSVPDVDSATVDTTITDQPIVRDPGDGKDGGGKGPGGGTDQPGGPGGQTTQPSKSMLGGAATLINENGSQTLKFNRAYTLDLGKSDGSVLEIGPGDKIERAQIHGNTLRGGNYHSASGEEKYLKGLNVRL